MLFLLIPWSLGLVSGTDALLRADALLVHRAPDRHLAAARVHLLVHAGAAPGQQENFFSDTLARTSFILFLVLSTPLGFHHQYVDPGIHRTWKLVHAFLTFAVFFPSLLTFFNVTASLENGARARGGKGWVAWFGKLPVGRSLPGPRRSWP